MSSEKTPNIKEKIIARTALVYVLLLIFILYLFIKLFQIIFLEKDQWQKKINEIAVDLKEDMPDRGNIYDEKEKILATSVSYFDIRMDTRAGGLTDKLFNKNIDSLSYYLSHFLKDKTQSEYKLYLKKARKNSVGYLKIANKLTYDEFVTIKEFPLFNLSSNKGGFISKRTTLRKRPFAGLLRRTIGFLGEDKKTGLIQGKAGLEYTYNRELGGRAGKSYMQKIGGGNWRNIKGGEVLETEHGVDLITTIDIDLQDYVDDILRKQLTNLKADYGSVVVMEVETGYIKAVANLKRYKNNTFAEVLNYAVGENLAPGSTFKLPVLMAVLEDGYVDLDDYIQTGNGHIMYHGVPVDDAGDASYGTIPVWKVFAKSSNVGMLKIIDDNYVKKGRIERFLKQLNAIGIGEVSGVDIYGEHKPFINNPDYHDLWARSSPGMIAHGYEVKISPLQLLTFYNAVANDGVMMKPRIVKRLEKNGIIIKEFKPEISNSMICSKSTLLKAQQILRDVVVKGTANDINTDKYKISGKTGTTEHYDIKQKRHTEKYRASFVGYFPSDRPKYSIIVVINKPQKDYYGALAAAPVFKKIADKIFSKDSDINPPVKTNINSNAVIPYSKNGFQNDLNRIFATVLIPVNNETNSEWISTETQKDMVVYHNMNFESTIMPDLKFMGARDAIYIIEKMGLKPILRGKGFVLNQSVEAGTNVKKGTRVLIELR
ncbi:MAG: transpeptidase family protein [Bacteroidales bacterium]|nr:transpeptidase family protein [Bacteroidales bacterium]